MAQVLNMVFWLTGLAASVVGAICLVQHGQALVRARRKNQENKPRMAAVDARH